MGAHQPVAGFAIVLAGALGCHGGDGAVPSPPSTTGRASVDVEDPATQVEILIAVAVRRVRLDNDGVRRNFNTIAVVDTVGIGDEAGFVMFDGPLFELTPALRMSLVRALSQDLEFVGSAEA